MDVFHHIPQPDGAQVNDSVNDPRRFSLQQQEIRVICRPMKFAATKRTTIKKTRPGVFGLCAC
jgi:hypothetical protein